MSVVLPVGSWLQAAVSGLLVLPSSCRGRAGCGVIRATPRAWLASAVTDGPGGSAHAPSMIDCCTECMFAYTVDLMGGVDPSCASLGRREQNKVKTRRALQDAALELALEQGVESVTVEAISEGAEVASRTFFNYFACKEDALVAEAADVAVDLHPMIIERPSAEPPLRALRAVIAQSDFVSAVHADRERILARQRLVQQHPPLMSRQLAQYARVEETFADALAERLGVTPGQDLRAELLAALTVSVLRVAMRRWTADGQQPLYQQIDAAFDLLERGELSEPPPRRTR